MLSFLLPKILFDFPSPFSVLRPFFDRPQTHVKKCQKSGLLYLHMKYRCNITKQEPKYTSYPLKSSQAIQGRAYKKSKIVVLHLQ